MKVFDFDNTIYNGESSFDFALFMVKKKKSLLKYLPHLLYFLILYKLCLLSPDDFVKRLEKFMNVFIENKEFTLQCIKEFWLLNIEKLYPHMLKKITLLEEEIRQKIVLQQEVQATIYEEELTERKGKSR